MDAWVVVLTFDQDADMAEMDSWEDGLADLDASVSRVPDRGSVMVIAHPPAGLSMFDAAYKVTDQVAMVIGAQPVGMEVMTELEFEVRAESPTMPELMSAAEIADELRISRQRVHQLRETVAFPAPLAELRGGAVWDAAAVRKFGREWERKPGRPAVGAKTVTGRFVKQSTAAQTAAKHRGETRNAKTGRYSVVSPAAKTSKERNPR
ncbi:hypothetical protein A5717_26075 [Mycolicibacterium porcinum]|uniref:hypothetical protein n=1 Tax=Mycolicibacterium porcinum TaxID=39693 RepID=UPI00080B5A4B|nr:hypothetical protein [Mycolicibacterium porcinum]OCB09245.1 hypothetical protein A5717_26075 [Mycolicibacterium porcinum]